MSLRRTPALPLRALHPRRVAVVSLHTSPLDQPGVGDAGGMNVYVLEASRRLAALGVEVEIFTRATSSRLDPRVEVEPGVVVHHVRSGPFEDLRKEELPAQLCSFGAEMLRIEAAHPRGWFDLIHSHYWLSGQVGSLASARWDVPLVHSMHTMARVKNLDLAEGDTPEPGVRVMGERQVVLNADRLIANTGDEAAQLIDLYDADPARVAVVHPGVDLDMFTPGDRDAARRAVGVAPDAMLLLFVGRIQPLKAPDLLLEAVRRLIAEEPGLRGRLVVAVNGGPSGSGTQHPDALQRLARELGIADIVRFEQPAGRERLLDWYRAADLTVVPSYSESFGLVAVESQACGTPVLAASVGGLRTAVDDGRSGILVAGHDPRAWAGALHGLVDRPAALVTLRAGARGHAERFSWDSTAQGLLDAYRAALHARSAPAMAVVGR